MGEVLGAIAALAQLINYGFAGANGIYDVTKRARSAPQTLQQWNDEVQGFLQLASELEAESHHRDSELQRLLRQNTDNGNALTSRLQALSFGDKDGRMKRCKTALKLVLKEKEISRALSACRFGGDSLHKHSVQATLRDIRQDIGFLSNHFRQIQSSTVTTLTIAGMRIDDFKTYVPPPNPKFIGQAERVCFLWSMLDPTVDKCPYANRTVLAGLGGAGKSELAREIAVHAIATSPHLLIFWLDGSTAHNFHTQFQRMLRPNTESEATSKFLTAEYVKERLESIDSPPWLMIIDNACSDTFFNHEEMHRLIPNTIRGRILITSRNRSLARRLSPQAHIVDMHGMGDNDARNLFYSRFSRDRCHKEDVDALLRAVGCLPFAIIQAAQVITSRNMDIQQYLHILYSNSFTPSGSVASGFEITTHPKPRDDNSSIICLKSLDEENPQAIRLLATLSLLHDQSLPADIPKKLANEVQAIDALSVLTDYDLIKPGYKNNTLDLNLLVRVLVRSKLPYMVGTNEIIWPLLNILDRQFPTAFWNPDCLDQGQRYLAHVASFIDSLVQLYSLKLPCKDMISQVALLVSRLVYLLRDLSLYDQAKSTSEKALSWLSRQEPSPMRFSNILLNHLAALEYRMGHYEVASMILDRHLKIRLCLHVEGNLEIIRTLNTLALVKQGQGELDDALEIHRRVRSMKDRLLGVGHIGTLSTLTNLGLCLQAQGKHVEAECLMRKVLDERKQRLGLYNLLTLKSMSNLATSLQLQGRYLEAEELYRVSLDGGQSLLAEDHHDVLRRKYNLATVLHYQNKTDSAEKEYRGLTAAFEHKFGLDHPETITVYEGLASLLPNLEEAEETMKKIIPSVQRSYGKRHARTLGALYHLSILLYHQNKFSEALLLGIEILEVRQKDLGPHHSDTRAALEYVKDLRSCVQPIDEKLVSGSEVLQLYENSRKVRLGRFMGFKLQMRYSPFLPVIYFLATLALVVLICYMSF